MQYTLGERLIGLRQYERGNGRLLDITGWTFERLILLCSGAFGNSVYLGISRVYCSDQSTSLYLGALG
jgi:hypothetical protein